MRHGIVIFDFDNTLFKTRQFWREYLFPVFHPIGISHEKCEEAFIEATQQKADHFVAEFFIESMTARNPGLAAEIHALFWNAVSSPEVRKWFYPGAETIVAKARETYESIALVSYGNAAFKELFFETCGIYEWFTKDDVTITSEKKPGLKSGLKVGLVDSWHGKGPVTFINDVLQETIEVVARAEELGITICAYNISDTTHTSPHGSIHIVTKLEEIEL